MLTRFAVTNYRGFRHRLEWKLDQPSNFAFNNFAVKDGIVKNGLIYGPNGSGKSNLGLALFDIENHLSAKTKHQNYSRNYLYGGADTGTADFEYSFTLGDNRIDYRYSKNYKGELVSETLKVNGTDAFRLSQGEVWFNPEHFSISDEAARQFSERANSISAISYLTSSQPLASDHYLLALLAFVDNMLWFRCLGFNEYIGFEDGKEVIDEYLIKNNLVEPFRIFLAEASEQNYEFVASEDEKTLLCVFGDRKLPFNEISSTGTKALRLLYYWLSKLDRVSLVFIDEFDAFYHMRLSKAVCRVVFERKCQGFMTTHNTSLLQNDLLRPDCNFILDKNRIESLPHLTPKELREGHNIEKLYRGHTFEI